ncbi:hypothetical protein RMSM_04899 [Rhodopirellula maiorica SM1]|uniref:Uncharacterized protein n=1 Tax=Rhodopirellula maiorica SM1 TaxID=1265738 RepID=M5RS19_9BACT|nr:hypothetical protein RMSM_04899 [Rhodopirellula maiorica SM1]
MHTKLGIAFSSNAKSIRSMSSKAASKFLWGAANSDGTEPPQGINTTSSSILCRENP